MLDTVQQQAPRALRLPSTLPVEGSRSPRRVLATEAASAAAFLAFATVLAVSAPWPRALSPVALVVIGASYVAAAKVRFPVGVGGWTAPTELVFVPMLFILPTPLVPLVVAGCSIVELLLNRPLRVSATSLLTRLGDSAYALGPVTVLAVAGQYRLSWDLWPLLLLAFAAQVFCDASSGLARAWFADHSLPHEEVQVPWLYASDACLACVGVVIAVAATRHNGLPLLVLCVFPLLGLLSLSASDRRELMRSRRHLAEAQLAAGMGSAESDATGRHILWSGAVRRIHNLPEDTPPSIDAILASVSAQDAIKITQRRDACMANGEPVEADYTVLANSLGPERVVHLHLSRARDPSLGLLATYQDVTDRARRNRAEAANRAKTEFLSRMSHELRTPLNAILGFGQLLAHAGLPEQHSGNADRIVSAGRHLLELVDDVLDISRIETGRLRIALRPVDVEQLLGELTPMTELLARDRGLRVTVDQSPSEAWVLADRNRLRQALTNLLSNAVKYNSDGGEIRVTVVDRGSGRIAIAVADEGPGIPASSLPRLFIPFDRLGAEYSAIPGTGLGLAVTKALIDAMGGSLDLQTEPGRGSTFTVELRQVSPGSAGDEPIAPNHPGQLECDADGLVERNILLIEEGAANGVLLESIIESDPRLRLSYAHDGETGIIRATGERPDVVLLDMMLPDMPGEDVLRALAANESTSGIPIVAMVVDARPERIEELRALGAAGHLTKPFDIGEVVAAIYDLARDDAASERPLHLVTGGGDHAD